MAGAWADRRPDKRRIMIAADLGRALLLLFIPMLYVMGLLSMTELYVVAFLVGTLSVLFEVCRTRLFVSLVGKEDYIAANSLLNGSRATAFVAGDRPAVAALTAIPENAPIPLTLSSD